jgi:tetratricopeptide (TPR) repeat protein
MRNLRRLSFIIILCTLFINVTCREKYENYRDMPVRVIGKEIIDKIQRGEYGYVGDYIDYLADKKPYSTEGTRILEDLYDYIEEKKVYEESLNKWCAMENPHYSAFLFRGRYHIKDAWRARGGEYAYAVSDEDRALFKERLRLAKEDLEKAYSMSPKDPNSASAMITVCMGLSLDEDIMEGWFEKAVKADPISFDAYSRKLLYLAPKWHGTPERYFQFAQHCYTEAPKKSIIQENMIHYMVEISNKVNAKQYFGTSSIKNLVDEVYFNTLKKFPKAVYLRKEYANIQIKIGDYEGAINTLTEALVIDPDNPLLLLARGDVYHEWLKNYRMAEIDYRKSVESDPDIPLTYFQLGEVFHKYHKDYKKADEYYNKAIELYPKEKSYFLKRGFNRIVMEQNFDSALEDFNEAEKLDRLDFYANYYKAMCLHELGRFEEAKQYYQKGLTILEEEKEKGNSDIGDDEKIGRLKGLINNHMNRCEKGKPF